MSLTLLTVTAVLPLPLPAPSSPTEMAVIPTPIFQDEAAATAPKWTGSVNLGANFTSGNSDVTTINANADAERKTDEDRWSGNVFHNMSEQGDPGMTTQENSGLVVQYDRFVSERMYWLASADYYTDDVATLDSRTKAGVGLGYQFKDTKEFAFRGEAGIEWVNEDFAGGAPEDYYALKLGSVLGWQINERVRLANDSEFLPSIEGDDDMTARSDTRLNINLSEKMQATIQYVLNWDNTPAAGIERADHRFVVTLGWLFGGD